MCIRDRGYCRWPSWPPGSVPGTRWPARRLPDRTSALGAPRLQLSWSFLLDGAREDALWCRLLRLDRRTKNIPLGVTLPTRLERGPATPARPSDPGFRAWLW